MLEIKNVSFRLAGKLIFSSATAYIPTGSKVGIVGRNGVGKTTLFKLIKNEYILDSGEIRISKEAKVGGVSQDVPNGCESLISTVISADLELKALRSDERSAEDATRIAEIHEKILDLDGYSAEARASSILHGLGFNNEEQKKPCNAFSGGWQMRVALASALFAAPDLLLLDEPTNYLDLEGTIWLESFLSNYSKTVILISHDRSILTRSVNKILHVEHEKLTLFSGNYDVFIRSYNAGKHLEQSRIEKEEIKKAHMEAFINKFRAKASKAKQAQSRLKALKKLQLKPQLQSSNVPKFYIPSPHNLPSPLISLSEISVGYNENIILKNLNLRIDPGDKIALLGPNGEGKSTFSKLLAGRLLPAKGSLIKSGKLQVGYFSQNVLDNLIVEESAFDHLEKHLIKCKKEEIISKLVLCGITEKQVSIPIKNLSGGQKARLAILLATVNSPHLLILDEPTNHLDIESRAELAKDLNQYSGAVLLVSHDPYLIDSVATELWLVKNSTVTRFKSNLDSYQKLLLSGDTKASKNSKKKKLGEVKLGSTKNRILKQTLKNQLIRAEARIEKLTNMRKLLDKHLNDPLLYSQSTAEKVKELQIKNKELNQAIILAEEIWMRASEKIENQT